MKKILTMLTILFSFSNFVFAANHEFKLGYYVDDEAQCNSLTEDDFRSYLSAKVARTVAIEIEKNLEGHRLKSNNSIYNHPDGFYSFIVSIYDSAGNKIKGAFDLRFMYNVESLSEVVYTENRKFDSFGNVSNEGEENSESTCDRMASVSNVEYSIKNITTDIVIFEGAL